MIISAVFQKELEDSLCGTYLSADDFLISEGKDNARNPMINIFYRYFTGQPKYSLLLYIRKGSFKVAKRPGKVLELESIELTDKGEVLLEIRKWIDNIETEFKIFNEVNEIIKNREQRTERIKGMEQSLSGIGNEQFSTDEVNKLIQRVSTLEELFLAQLEEEIKDKELLRNEINKFKKDISFLKMQVSILNKKNWLFAFDSRISQWRKRNPRAVEALDIKNFEVLPEAVKMLTHSEID
ncbi:hypothetical protein BVG16_13695 [Paenibacillus selenitireducens]|uniref:Uncharacterized protein n=1 Tax=Paenibacillus selenitireducens TaxID=1324314 RepID=A0A1T2XC82_9BACL|nr:hypothetical protein [Paenibacillus selenitireducens]OPA77501.1 hypothetical protein BVG16_13695 [Paenibacillus selenitireducens]